MSAAVWVLARDTFRALVRRRANAVLLILLFWLLIMVSCSLRVSGTTVINGQAMPVDEFGRLKLAIGSAFGGLHFLGMLIVLFILTPVITGELEGAMAHWVLVKPISRRTFLWGRLIGAFLFLAAFSGLVLVGVEFLLARHLQRPQLAPLLGWLVMLFLLALYLVLAVLFSLHLGGAGPLVLFFLAVCGAVVDTDALTRRFLGSGEVSEGLGVLDVLLVPMFGWETPPMPMRVLYGALYFLMPGSGNIHDLAVTLSVGQRLPVPLDYWSLALAGVALPAALLLTTQTLSHRDL